MAAACSATAPRSVHSRRCRHRKAAATRISRAAGVQIEALAEYVRLYQMGEETWEDRRALLVDQREKLRARMEEMRQSLERLDYKISLYEQKAPD